ncbi:hypothetical protein J5N97_016737 [Dioscorea zingiberensis]|uniref:KIB1-4 beta-propeller domain-containing protein n=1 Tax=Dioscorea zingiberensis TaxID=325984 RepID=A0A9D5CLM8_9LILI|nr:hypothetical protein J5N97_016737 [Dioscorea zingiberensis]
MEDKNVKNPARSPTHEWYRDWSALPSGPLQNIAGSLNTISHRRLRQVWSSWRASTPKRPRCPLLITTSPTEAYGFYDIDLEEWNPLPSNYPTDLQSHGTRYAGCSFGWLALAKEEPVLGKVTISLVNPFTFARVELSELTGMCLFGGHFLLSGSPANLLQPPMVLYHNFYPRELKFQQVGDKEWKTIKHSPSSLKEVIACNGRFYSFDSSNALYSVDLQANNGNGAVVQLLLDLPDIFSSVPPPRWKFLADFSGDLVVMCSDHIERQLFLKMDLENDRLVLMPNMADSLLFQCESCSFFVPGDHRSLQFKQDGRHIVHTGNPNNMIIIYSQYWKHPDPKISWRAFPLGWIKPDLNKS